MIENSLQAIYLWGREHLGQSAMFSYKLFKINGQTPGSVFILLKHPDSIKANAEIQIVFAPDRVLPYSVSFTLLSESSTMPSPSLQFRGFSNATEVIEWILSGSRWV